MYHWAHFGCTHLQQRGLLFFQRISSLEFNCCSSLSADFWLWILSDISPRRISTVRFLSTSLWLELLSFNFSCLLFSGIFLFFDPFSTLDRFQNHLSHGVSSFSPSSPPFHPCLISPIFLIYLLSLIFCPHLFYHLLHQILRIYLFSSSIIRVSFFIFTIFFSLLSFSQDFFLLQQLLTFIRE